MSDGKSEEELEKIRKLLEGQGRERSRSSSGSATDAGGGWGGFGGILENTAKTGADALNNLWRGTLNVSDGFTSLTNVLKNADSSFARVFGDISQKVGAAIIDTTASLNKSGQNGADFNMDIAEYDRLLKGARMTHEQYNDMIKHSATDLAGLGGGINKAQKNFLEIAKGFQESDIGAKFKELGWNTDELNEVTKVAMSNRKGMDMHDPINQQKAVLATDKLAMAIDENSRILGLSRKDQLEMLQKSRDEGDLEAKMLLAGPQARANYKQAEADSVGMGDSFKRVMKEAFTGKTTAEGSEAAAATGTATAAIRAYGQSLKDTTEEGEKRSLILGQKARAAELEYMNSKGALEAAALAGGNVAEKMGKELVTSKTQGVYVTKQAEATGEGRKLDAEAALKELSTAAANRRVGKKEDGSENDTPGANVAQTLNKADRTLSDMFAGSADIFSKLVGATDDVINKFSNLSGELLKPHTQEQMNPSSILPKKRSTGSPEIDTFIKSSSSFSSMFEQFNPKGEMVELHGSESVVTPPQMEGIIKKFIPTDIKDTAKQPIDVAKPQNAIIPPDLMDIVKRHTTAATPKQNDMKPFTIDLPTSGGNQVSENKTESKSTVTQFLSPTSEAQLIKTVNETVYSVFDKAFKPMGDMMHNVTKHVEKTVEVKKAEPKKEEPKKEEKSAEVKKEEEKLAEVKKEEPKLLDLGIKTAEDLNKFIYGTQQSGTKPAETKSADGFPPIPGPAMTNRKPHWTSDEEGIDQPTGSFKQIDYDIDTEALQDQIAYLRTRHDEDAEHDLPIYDEMLRQHLEKGRPADEVIKGGNVEKEMKTFNDSLKNMGGPETFKEIGSQLTDSISTALPSTEKLEETMTSASDTFKSTDFNKAFASVGDSFASANVSTPAVEEKVPNASIEEQQAQLKKDNDKTVDNYLAANPTAELVDPDKDKAKDNSPGIFDKFTNLFNSNDKPAFASGNVKYETIPQAEIDARDKELQKTIGTIDNSPEAIEARNAELDRQKNSGMYKQKEPEKHVLPEIKKPAETKEQSHIKDMYKKFGLESFNDYNARLTAEEHAKKPDHSKLAEIKTPTIPTIKAPEIKAPVVSGESLKPPTPPVVHMPHEEHKPAEQPKSTAQVVEKQVSLKDILDAVTKLNNTMTTMAHHTDKISTNSHKQISATQSLSNSRF
jgi:hypothetical protein